MYRSGGLNDHEHHGDTKRETRASAHDVRSRPESSPLERQRHTSGNRAQDKNRAGRRLQRQFTNSRADGGDEGAGCGAGVDPGASRAHGQLRRKKMERPIRSLVADVGSNGVERARDRYRKDGRRHEQDEPSGGKQREQR